MLHVIFFLLYLIFEDDFNTSLILLFHIEEYFINMLKNYY